MFLEAGLFLTLVLVFAILMPHAGRIIGPILIVVGIVPVTILFFLPQSYQAHANEHYGLLSTLLFIALVPAGCLLTFIGFLADKR